MTLLYTARADVSGGRNGHGRTDDGKLDVKLSRPGAMGGEGAGTNPEQLFAVGYAACFEGALGAASRRSRVKMGDTSVHAEVSLHSTDDGAFRITASLDVTIKEIDEQAAVELVRNAHLICPYSNALRGNVDVRLTANGTWVAGSDG